MFTALLITFNTEHGRAQLTASLLTCNPLIKFIVHIFFVAFHGLILTSLLTATLMELTAYNPRFYYCIIQDSIILK